MIADGIKLVEFILNQFSKAQDKKEKLLEQFVEPAYSQLQVIHEDYLKACRKYWEYIRHDEPLNLIKVINEIDQDVRFAPHESRIELLASLQSDETSLQDFINSIRKYLLGSQVAVREKMVYSTQFRNQFPNRRVGVEYSIKTNLLAALERYSKNRWQLSSKEIDLLKKGKIVLPASVEYTMELEPNNPLINISDDPEEATKHFDEYIRYRALAYVDCFIAILQRDYAEVSNSYWSLKRKLQGIN
ncbi:unknown protein [Nostoc sp. NIES-3756]|uniref:hypothetical protein n=1 Tax=Nostoc sp. NIES-3756 TaxID=1751286 RepID=UPI0007207802|nr:hypothetical protein [Nostoc sp. NIES-3756]BAT52616.1 unknown protein [Nostoc sp. NIES-3756]